MLIGFLVTSKEDLEDLKKAIESAEGKQIVHFHEREPESFAPGSGSSAAGGGGERAGAVDEVETWDETEDGEDV